MSSPQTATARCFVRPATPARYIHSHNSIINLNDYLQLLSLTIALVRALDATTVAELTTYL